MRQTYKINIEGRELVLMQEDFLADFSQDANQLILPYRGTKNTLFQYLDTLEKSSRFQSIILYTNDVKTLFGDLKSLLILIRAAGGVIESAEGNILLIFRKGVWDLPKGKLDTQETAKIAALRECEEETGLTNLMLGEKIYETYHHFRDNGQRALKKTKWFAMNYQGDKMPKPQTEEGITDIIWSSPQIALNKEPMYENIKAVIGNFLKHKIDKHIGT